MHLKQNLITLKISPTLPKTSPPLQKQFKPSRENLNLPQKFLPWPLPLPENSITVTETTSSTLIKSQPFPCENFSIPPEKSQPLPPKQICQPP